MTRSTPRTPPKSRTHPHPFSHWLESNSDRVERAFASGKPAYWLRDNSALLKLTKVYENLGFSVVKIYDNGGMVLVHRSAETKKGDYKDLMEIAYAFASQGSFVQIPPRIHRDEKIYNEIYRTRGMKYYGKCPDLIIDGKNYEYESFQRPWNKRKLSHQLSNGLKQSDRIIIDTRDSGLKHPFIRKAIFNRIKGDPNLDIAEVWTYEGEGQSTLVLVYEKHRASSYSEADSCGRTGRSLRRSSSDLYRKDTTKIRTLTSAKARHEARTPETIADIQHRWDERNARIKRLDRLEKARLRHEARTPEEVAEIKRRWEVRNNILVHSDELERLSATYATIAPSLSKLSGETLTLMRSGELRGQALQQRLARLAEKEQAKLRWDATQPVRRLATILDNPLADSGVYSLESLQAVYKAVQAKLSSIKGLSLETLKGKLEFEIKWVEEHKKYDTWQVAQRAYAKRLREVEREIKLVEIKSQTAYALAFAKTTKSKPTKILATELEGLLSQKWGSVSAAEKKAMELRTKVDKLIAKKKVGKLPSGSPFSASDYTQERKNAAVWDKGNGAKADAALIDMAGTQWKMATKEEKDYTFEYTHHYCNINEPLQGRRYVGYQTRQDFVRKVSSIESYIDKNALPVDMWFTRGDDGLSVIASRIRFAGGTMPENLEDLVGLTMQEGGFMSTGSRKGKGFSHKSVILNIYAPRGTKAAYIEPISSYGNGAQRNWDGVQRFSSFSAEHETLFQRGTKMRITKVYREGGRIFIDCEVVEQTTMPLSYVKDTDIGL